MKKFGLISIAVGAFVSITALTVLGATSVSRLADLVIVGLGGNTQKTITLDTGHTVSNAQILSPGAGGLQLSGDGGTHKMTVPLATDTLVGRDTVDTLTNKVIPIPDFDFSITNGGHSLFFDGAALTATRVLSVQNASGSIALTSQVPLNCNYYSATDSSGSSVFVAVTCGGGSVLAGWCGDSSSGGHLYNSALTSCSGSGGATRCTTQHCDWENAGGTLTATAICCTY